MNGDLSARCCCPRSPVSLAGTELNRLFVYHQTHSYRKHILRTVARSLSAAAGLGGHVLGGHVEFALHVGKHGTLQANNISSCNHRHCQPASHRASQPEHICCQWLALRPALVPRLINMHVRNPHGTAISQVPYHIWASCPYAVSESDQNSTNAPRLDNGAAEFGFPPRWLYKSAQMRLALSKKLAKQR